MQRKSLSSAERIYRNRDKIIDDLKTIARNIEREFSAKEIILFGSIARGDYGLYSDADILIILEKSEKKRYFDRIPELIGFFAESPIHVDIFPYTLMEINRMKDSNLFINRALKEGISLLG